MTERKGAPAVAAPVPPVVMPDRGLFRNAITEADGVSVNVGYLSLFWMMVVVLGAIPILLILGFVQLFTSEHHSIDLQQLGIAIGAVCTGFGAALAALGAFLWGDRRPMPPSTSVSINQTTVP